MRALCTASIAITLLALGCTTAKPAGPAMPDLSPAPAGTLTVGLASGAENPAAQADALAAWVKSATGHATRTAIFPDYDSLASAVAKGQVDVALMSPLAYVRAEDQGHPHALGRMVRHGASTYRAVLFSKAGSKLKTLDDLKKADQLRVAWVDSSSATGYIFPKALLLQNKIDPAGLFKNQDFLGSHNAVCQAVLSGKYDLGATFSDDPSTSPVAHLNGCDDPSSLQIVAVSGNIPTDILATRDGLDADVSTKLSNGANELASSEAGKATLQSAFRADGIAPIAESDLDVVRQAIDSFHEHIQ